MSINWAEFVLIGRSGNILVKGGRVGVGVRERLEVARAGRRVMVCVGQDQLAQCGVCMGGKYAACMAGDVHERNRGRPKVVSCSGCA